jgi:hypothetical protein
VGLIGRIITLSDKVCGTFHGDTVGVAVGLGSGVGSGVAVAVGSGVGVTTVFASTVTLDGPPTVTPPNAVKSANTPLNSPEKVQLPPSSDASTMYSKVAGAGTASKLNVTS